MAPLQNNVFVFFFTLKCYFLRCQVDFIWCWDFNGFIHEKFVLEEKKRVAMRLSKIGTQVFDRQTQFSIRF